MTAPLVRALALYLPQFHPVAENDEWWGPGFTEWTNLARARPLFRGHHQPHVPGELGFYDLRIPEVRQRQAELAEEAGIEGFMYWHYWFAGRRMLERPFAEVLASGEPRLPFCIAWANQSWTGVWYGESNRVLVEQTYPGRADYIAHFDSLLPAFRDERYVRVDGKPVVAVFRPTELPDALLFTSTWRERADAAGLEGLHLVGFDHHGDWDPRPGGFDAAIDSRFGNMFGHRGRNVIRTARRRLQRSRLHALSKLSKKPIHVYPYEEISALLIPSEAREFETYPCAVPNWDNTPRSGSRGSVLQGSTPQLFQSQVERAVGYLEPLPPSRRLMIIKSWNEWAEGNYLEPDREWGNGYLEAVRAAVKPGNEP